MNLQKGGPLVLGFMLLAVVVLVLISGGGPSEPGPAPDPDPAAIERFPDDSEAARWHVAAHLAELASAEPPPPPAALSARLELAGKSPQEILSLVDAHVTAEPYRGAMRSAATAYDGGAANPLDRARLLRELLLAAGHEARIVSGAGTVRYPETTPDHDFRLDPTLREQLEEEVASLTPPLWEAAQKNTAWVEAASAPPAPPRVYWAQAQSGDAWLDLVPQDTTREEGDPEPLSPADELAATWTVTLRLLAEYAEFDGEWDSWSYTAPAEALHAQPVTLFYRLQNIYRCTPTLLVGAESVPLVHALGEVPPANAEWRNKVLRLSRPMRDVLSLRHTGVVDLTELGSVKLRVEITGPDHAAEHERVLVPQEVLGPGDYLRPIEKLLRMATVTRFAIATGAVAPEAYGRGIHEHARFAGRSLLLDFDDPGEVLNLLALRPLSLLDASQRAAGHFGERAAKALCFRERPGLALESEFAVVQGERMQPIRTLDVLDFGHGVRGPDAAQAAVEQGLVDACLEELATAAPHAVTSGRVLAAALEAGDAFTADPPGGSDLINGSPPGYLLATHSGVRGGARLDPGPQLLPILGDGSGGSRVALGPEEERLRDGLATANLAKVYVPKQLMPYGPLLGGLTGFLLKLRQAYGGATEALDWVARRMDGEAERAELDAITAQMQKDIADLGPTLVKGIVDGVVDQITTQLIPKLPLGRARPVVSPPLKEWIAKKLRKDFEDRFLSPDGLEPDAAPPERPGWVPRSAVAATQAMKASGLDRVQRRAFLVEHGGEANATQVTRQLAQEGAAYDATQLAPREREVLESGSDEHREARWEEYLSEMQRAGKAPQGRGVFDTAYEANVVKAQQR